MADPVSPPPLLMIPGPVEISPAVLAAAAGAPPSHVSPGLIQAFGSCLGRMRQVWKADESSQPFLLAGSGTLAMEAAAANLIEPGDRALVVVTGFFSERMTEILRRNGAEVVEVTASVAPVGDAPSPDEVREALAKGAPFKALFATHVDTSTGVRVDPEPLCRLAREANALAVFDGVCATGGERFEMADWGADLYFTASQKALGVPPGLALMVASQRALWVRSKRKAWAPPLYLDWHSWLPVHRAYEEGSPAYFATPATSLVKALDAGLGEILLGENAGIDARIAAHARAAAALRAAWRALGLRFVPRTEAVTGNTLSVLLYPEGIDAGLLPKIAARGVVVAGGLHPAVKTTSFRVGHMGYTVTRPDFLHRAVNAVGGALRDQGAGVDVDAALSALAAGLSS